MTSTVVLIHGTNAGPWTMQRFAGYFEQAGFECHSPAYRDHGVSPSEEVSARLVGVSIADYVEDIASYVDSLGTKPVLVGHSLGGVIAQKLAARGLARAIVSVNGSLNWGILPTTDAERALGRTLMSAGAFWEGTLLPDFDTMVKFGLNKLDPADQRRAFDQLGPESGRAMFELFFWMFDENQTTKVDYDRIDCPVLMVSGSEDLAVPPSTARGIAERYSSEVTFHEAAGYGHYLMLEPEWEKIAALCAAWIDDVATAGPP
ncbi:MAG: alpha/beta hydrolase [Myxococcota bacterium]